MNIFDIISNNADDLIILSFFVKSFGIMFSFLYLLYAIVIGRHAQVLNRTVQTGIGPLINAILLIQIIVGVGLLILAIILL